MCFSIKQISSKSKQQTVQNYGFSERYVNDRQEHREKDDSDNK